MIVLLNLCYSVHINMYYLQLVYEVSSKIDIVKSCAYVKSATPLTCNRNCENYKYNLIFHYSYNYNIKISMDIM